MRLGSLARVVGQSLWRARFSLGLAATGVAVGIGALAFFLALSAGMRGTLREVFPAEQLEAVAPSGGGALSLLGGAPPALEDSDLERIRSLPGVKAAYPRMTFGFPTKAWGGESLLQGTRYTELIGDGIPPELVDDLPPGAEFRDLSGESSLRSCGPSGSCPSGEYCDEGGDAPRCERLVPVVVSPYLMEVYNELVAPRSDLPRVSRWMVDRIRGLSFRVRLGESYVGRAACADSGGCRPRNVEMQLVGVSRYAVGLGVSVPIEYVVRWNREYAGEQAGRRYARAVVEARSEREVTGLVAELRRHGYEVPSNRAQQAGLAVTVITALLALTSLLIILVAAVNIAHTFFSLVHERREEIGLYRALGATRGDVRAIVLSEAAVLGLVAGSVGLLLARAGAWAGDLAWSRHVPDFPFKPDSLFAFPPSLVALAMGFAVLCCLVGAAFPARRASRVDPARALS